MQKWVKVNLNYFLNVLQFWYPMVIPVTLSVLRVSQKRLNFNKKILSEEKKKERFLLQNELKCEMLGVCMLDIMQEVQIKWSN